MGCGCNKNTNKNTPCVGDSCKKEPPPPVIVQDIEPNKTVNIINYNVNIENMINVGSVNTVNNNETIVESEKFMSTENTPKNSIEFKTNEKISTPTVFKKIEMAKSFISAIASRGVQNNKVSIPLKQLRVLGCFGNKDKGGELPPCEFLRKSNTPGKFFCGGCGCGDKKLTWLMGNGDEYSKLDYPTLNCPLHMPGFTNYKESGPEEAISPITRRYYIENMKYEDVEKVQVSLPDISTEEKLPDPPS